MLTRSRLKQWGSLEGNSYVLCNVASEDLNHIFFACEFAATIWVEVLRRNGIDRGVSIWDMEMIHCIAKTKWKDFRASLRKLSIAVRGMHGSVNCAVLSLTEPTCRF